MDQQSHFLLLFQHAGSFLRLPCSLLWLLGTSVRKIDSLVYKLLLCEDGYGYHGMKCANTLRFYLRSLFLR